jgi:hypothetical protein
MKLLQMLKLFSAETERNNDSLAEYSLLDYLFSGYIIFFCFVPPGMCLRRIVPVINWTGAAVKRKIYKML